MIAVLIGYKSIARFISPVPIHFAKAIPIAFLGLADNVASAWLLSSGGHDHHDHGHAHGDNGDHHGHDEAHRIVTPEGVLVVSVYEVNHPPVFRIRAEGGAALSVRAVTVETVRPDGARQFFMMEDRGGYLQSVQEISEPHAFTANVQAGGRGFPVVFEEHEHGHDAHDAAHRDNNMGAAIIHVMADAAVSVLVIIGLVLARAFCGQRDARYYREKLARIRSLSHVTVEVDRAV